MQGLMGLLWWAERGQVHQVASMSAEHLTSYKGKWDMSKEQEAIRKAHTASLSGDERVVENHPLLDSGEGPQLLQDLHQVQPPSIQCKATGPQE